MSNAELAAAFKQLAQVMEYLGENSFKIRSYTRVADTLKKGAGDFASLSRDELLATEGIGEAIADKIIELTQRGQLELYERLASRMPTVALELLGVKGLGVKKVRQLVQELEVSSIGELLQAVDENRVVQLKGFSTVSQAKLKQQLSFFQASSGKLRFADAEPVARSLLGSLRQNSPRVEYAGDLRRQCNTLEALEFIAVDSPELRSYLESSGFEVTATTAGLTSYRNDTERPLRRVFLSSPETFGRDWIAATGSPAFLSDRPELMEQPGGDEEQVFAKAGIAYVPAPQRESTLSALPTPESEVVQTSDIRGVVHAHTTASDGAATLPVLAKAVRERGYAYLTVTDHSKAAGYANGLSVERLRAQVAEITAYNAANPDFKVFSGTECDILRDGRLDFEDEVLSELDIVIASVHSVLDMSPADATDRLLAALQNPYVTMLGHPTGRLLLSRRGYAPDMTQVLEACAANETAVEINASPMRLDLDWSYVPMAVEMGIKISINPDAHSIPGIDNIRYGVLSAQKAGLRASACLNCLGADEFETYLRERKRRRGIS